MSTGIFFLYQTTFYIVLLAVIFFRKKNFKSEENTMYKWLVITTLVETIIEIFLDIVGPLYNIYPFISFTVAKLYCMLITLWNCLLCAYIVIISVKLKKRENLLWIKKVYLF